MQSPSTGSLDPNQTRGLQYVEVFGDRLSRNGQRLGDLGQGEWSPGAKALEDAPTNRIGDGSKDVGHDLIICNQGVACQPVESPHTVVESKTRVLLRKIYRRRNSSVGIGAFIVAVSCLFGIAIPGGAASRTKDIFGWLEKVQVGESRLEMEAKLDTGADTSSLDASRVRRYREKDGDRWVEFLVVDKVSGRRIRYKKRLIRYAYIKEHEGPSQRRPVVRIQICLGDHLDEVEVSLADRSGFQYPILLGRNALENVALVDAAESFTSDPSCSAEIDR